MRQKLLLIFDDNDTIQWPTRIEEAFNRLTEFAPELHQEGMPRAKGSQAPQPVTVRTACNRIVCNCEFETSDATQLSDYAFKVAARARLAAKQYDCTNAAQLGDSIRQAAQNLEDTMREFQDHVAGVAGFRHYPSFNINMGTMLLALADSVEKHEAADAATLGAGYKGAFSTSLRNCIKAIREQGVKVIRLEPSK